VERHAVPSPIAPSLPEKPLALCVVVWEAVSGIWMTRRWNDELLHPQKQGESQWPHYLQQATKAGLFTWGEGCARNKDISFEMSVSSLWPRPYVSETGQHARAAAAVKKKHFLSRLACHLFGADV